MSETIYDVIIIGGGPAGLTAGIYTARERLQTLLLEKQGCGGWPNITGTIQNYPGFPEGINGMELSTRFKEQAQKFGVQIREFEAVEKISSGPDVIKVTTPQNTYQGRTLIIASGSRMRQLGIPGEKEFLGKGVSYCATCDGPLYRNKEVAVVGGGSAALEEALFLTKFVSRVYLIHRRDKFRGEKILVEELKKTGKVEFVLNSLPQTIEGSDFVESIVVKNKMDSGRRILKVEGVFVFVGVEPNTEFLTGAVELDRAGFIKTNTAMLTSEPGIFAAGDLREGNVRQIGVACGEGTVAALSVRNLLSDYDMAEIGRHKKISEIQNKITDLKSRLPAHSVSAAQLEELEELEEELAELTSKN